MSFTRSDCETSSISNKAYEDDDSIECVTVMLRDIRDYARAIVCVYVVPVTHHVHVIYVVHGSY